MTCGRPDVKLRLPRLLLFSILILLHSFDFASAKEAELAREASGEPSTGDASDGDGSNSSRACASRWSPSRLVGEASAIWSNMARFRPAFLGGRDDNLPDHLGPVKQLFCRTGHNLAVFPAGTVYGTREAYNRYAILELLSHDIGQVRIRGVETGLFVCMDAEGRVYAKKNRMDEEGIFYEMYEGGYNLYLSKLNKDKGWYLGIKKSGVPKPGPRTARGQKAVQFLPRAAKPRS
ncbi:fibroblast growth factor 1 isoform X3 [Rhipicephalus microplus]|uniref:fibroblast growth factor 1 isoform X3 n=1 Tax=Rhipicephalus microplus TaxID=6941 RepID=UPI003F6BBCDC